MTFFFLGGLALIGAYLLIALTRKLLSSVSSFPQSRAALNLSLGFLLLGSVGILALSPVGFSSQAPMLEELPIRVYPPDGRSAHVEAVTLQVEDPTGVDSLYVQAHQPSYTSGGWDEGVADGTFDPEGAAEIRLNGASGGSWVEVRDGTVDCAWPESAYGCVAGVYSTIRFTIPAETVQSGSNTIEFKFNGTKGVRSGYRVLGVGFMRGSDPSVQEFDPMRHGAHDASGLSHEGVAQWAPPADHDTQSDIQAGAQLWSETGRLVDVDGTDIRAACSSCHAKDGRDLKYFGYSNRVIVARSRAHGLTETEGQQIAAYIRSRPLRTEDGQSYQAPGRPWNPPYQPGPSGFGPENDQGPDQADPVYWAAGAGLEWVLDRPREQPGTRRDMLAHLFPKNGDPAQGVDWRSDPSSGHQELNWRRVSTDSTLNLRAMPLDLQLPDWNHWLPKIHPMDAVPDLFIGGEGQRWYQEELPEALASGNLGEVETATRRMVAELRRTDGVTNHSRPSGFSANKHALSRASVRQWLAVKFWETFHGHHLQNDVDEAYCDDPDRPWCEPLGWPGRQRIPFDIAGHISAPTGQQSSPWIYANEAQEKTFSHVWYHLQMVINPGTQPKSSSQSPVDVGYQRGHVHHAEEMGPPADFRQFQTEIKVWQLHSKTGRVDINNREWNANISRTNFFERVAPADPALHRALMTAGMRAWWDQMRRHAITDFPRQTTNPWYYPESEVPASTGWTSNQNQGQQTYQLLIESAQEGLLPAGLIDSIGTDWGQPMWPDTGVPPYDDRPRWDEIAGLADSEMPVELTDFTVSLDGTSALLTWKTANETGNAGFELLHRAPDAPAFSQIKFVEGAGTTSEPRSYRFRTDDLDPGLHQFRLRQVDKQGSTTLTDPVRVRVKADERLRLRLDGQNPVRRSTALTFTVKRRGPTTLSVYNILGQEVKRLYDREASPGQTETVTFPVGRLSSGTYFVRLRAPSGTQTKRLTVVK